MGIWIRGVNVVPSSIVEGGRADASGAGDCSVRSGVLDRGEMYIGTAFMASSGPGPACDPGGEPVAAAGPSPLIVLGCLELLLPNILYTFCMAGNFCWSVDAGDMGGPDGVGGRGDDPSACTSPRWEAWIPGIDILGAELGCAACRGVDFGRERDKSRGEPSEAVRSGDESGVTISVVVLG